MPSIPSSSISLASFQALAKTSEAVELKNGELKSTLETPAKVGFLGRIMQWIRGDSPSKVTAETKMAFMNAVKESYGSQIAKAAMGNGRLHEGNDKPLTAREITQVVNKANQLKKSLDEVGESKIKADEQRNLQGQLDNLQSAFANTSVGHRQKPMRGKVLVETNVKIQDIQAKLATMEGAQEAFEAAKDRHLKLTKS